MNDQVTALDYLLHGAPASPEHPFICLSESQRQALVGRLVYLEKVYRRSSPNRSAEDDRTRKALGMAPWPEQTTLER